jgi:gluconolactonase
MDDRRKTLHSLKMIPIILCLSTGVTIILANLLNAQQSPKFPEKIVAYPVVADVAFPEGPAFDSEGNLYFVNYVRNGTIGRKTPDGTVTVWVDLNTIGGVANGLKTDQGGNVIVADSKGKRLLRISPNREISILAQQFQGKPFLALNDVALDKVGNIYFTDPSGSSRENPIGGVYRFSVDHKLSLLDGKLAFPNGLAISPDQGRIYVAEMLASRIVVYDLSRDGVVSNKRTFYQYPGGNLDGMGFDEYSRLWMTRPENNCVDVFSENGELLHKIPTASTVTNLAWWGKSVYLTIAGEHSIHRLDVGVGPAK